MVRLGGYTPPQTRIPLNAFVPPKWSLSFFRLMLGVSLFFGMERVQATPSDSLSVLSWNIFMLPPPLFYSSQLQRADSIGEAIMASGADVVVFQEAFMGKAREIIANRIASLYPYHTGKPDGGGFLRFNSGIWVVSKYPLEKIKFIRYRHKAGFDFFSGKGALLVRVCHPDREIYVVGTHTQSAGYQGIRFNQYKQIKEQLYPLLDESEPLIVAGDLNTDRSSKVDYEEMIKIFGLAEGEAEPDEAHSYNGEKNDLARKYFGPEKSKLDYILSRKTAKIKHTGSRVKVYRASLPMGGGFQDLSDHYAVFSTFLIKY